MAHGRFNKRLVQIELPSAQKAPENIAGGCRTLPILPCRRRRRSAAVKELTPALFASNRSCRARRVSDGEGRSVTQ